VTPGFSNRAETTEVLAFARSAPHTCRGEVPPSADPEDEPEDEPRKVTAMVDITPAIPEGRQVIESYGEGGFRISGTDWAGSVLVTPDRTVPWPVAALDDIGLASLAPVLEGAPVDVLLIGCGEKMQLLPSGLRSALREAGPSVDVMATGAACRTFNVLMAEQRRVAAALLAV